MKIFLSYLLKHLFQKLKACGSQQTLNGQKAKNACTIKMLVKKGVNGYKGPIKEGKKRIEYEGYKGYNGRKGFKEC